MLLGAEHRRNREAGSSPGPGWRRRHDEHRAAASRTTSHWGSARVLHVLLTTSTRGAWPEVGAGGRSSHDLRDTDGSVPRSADGAVRTQRVAGGAGGRVGPDARGPAPHTQTRSARRPGLVPEEPAAHVRCHWVGPGVRAARGRGTPADLPTGPHAVSSSWDSDGPRACTPSAAARGGRAWRALPPSARRAAPASRAGVAGGPRSPASRWVPAKAI